MAMLQFSSLSQAVESEIWKAVLLFLPNFDFPNEIPISGLISKWISSEFPDFLML
jgi:hypothetical protein